MRYGITKSGERVEAQKGLKSFCPICGEELIAKCGTPKINHWAHKISRNCDPWWENETEWHRKWKDHFPENYQEYLMIDSVNGEKHIADIRIDKGFVVEFQHSSIKPEEKEIREAFYKNMLWVVDASKYYEKFKQAIESKILHHSKIYTKNELLLLINLGDKFITGVISMPSYLLDLQLCGSYNFYVRKLDVIEHYSNYKIFFDVNDERIYTNKETRQNLEFILNNFANNTK